MEDLVPIRRALLSVSDKTGLVAFATELSRTHHVELLSTGGTAALLREAGLPVTDVSAVTGFPEMMDGRVKTLHPKVHGGLLALRDNAEHVAAMKEHGIQPIDLVCVNLYPFEQTVAKPDVTFEEAIENIDIGGPSMIRSAAKNHAFVAVVTSSRQYERVLAEMTASGGKTTAKLRHQLAVNAFQLTSGYDQIIAKYLIRTERYHPAEVEISQPVEPASRVTRLRYGENPHQAAELLPSVDHPGTASVAHARQHHGKELSYINVLDADAALACVKEFEIPAACIVKHATPCGVGVGETVAIAIDGAYASDPLAAFGGIVAINLPMTVAAAEVLTAGQKFLEVIVAPSFDSDALELLKARWKNIRLLEVGPMFTDPMIAKLYKQEMGGRFGYLTHKRSIIGGELVQQPDLIGVVEGEWKTASTRPPTEAELADLRVAWLACKHVKSNAIVIAHGGATVGIGGGQVDRVNATRVAAEKAGGRARGAVAASDAFFPFPDGPEILLNAGVTALVHPGGSVRDQETIDLCNARGAALVLTGRRHFRH